jgi:phosphopantetheinyl transferase
VIPLRRIPVPGAPDQARPEIRLIDARAARLDEQRLRELVRWATGTQEGQRISRSYSFPFALLAWYDGPVGIDIERIDPGEPRFAGPIRTPGERLAAPTRDSDPATTSLSSSKEALAKALGDALTYDPRRLEGPAARPDGNAGPWRARSLAVEEGYVAWVCWQVQAR